MTWNFPAGVFGFMSTNLLASSVQNRLLKIPVLERLLEIPPTAEAQAAIAAAAASGPPALVPMGNNLRHAGFGSQLGSSTTLPRAADQVRRRTTAELLPPPRSS